ncbi:hypothetical protein SNEBB_002296 [Seison nebaliae]|nr:hypothetical protein SNEBB_002296 [Seison nebaliae]
MPVKASGAHKNRLRLKKHQDNIKNAKLNRTIAQFPSNSQITCSQCDRLQKNRAFCYFCSSVQSLIRCGECGKEKCMGISGDCVIRHPHTHTTGMNMIGAICDFCETFLCHSKKCLTTHACSCPLRDAECVECSRTVYDHGGRIFQCAYCTESLCEDDQFEHQAMCQRVDGESLKCGSCNRQSQFSCLRCKKCFCDEHVKRPHIKYEKSEDSYPCPKCNCTLKQTNYLSLSTRQYDFGRDTYDDY